MHKILILGPQGCGKGTQAVFLSKKLGIPRISMGELLRAAANDTGPLADEIHAVQSAGELVPDHIAIKVLDERLQGADMVRGYILDGFPRNEKQFKAYAAYDTPTLVLVIEVPPEVSIPRLMKRSELEHRFDDTPEIIQKRLQIYTEETKPMINHYVEQGLVRVVDGVGTIEEVADRIGKIFEV